MIAARKVAWSLCTLAHLAAPAVGGAVATTMLVACADETDPQTWVKRLDDPKQRTAAIKRLRQFFDDELAKANKDRDNANVQALLAKIADPLTKTYLAGGLTDQTRKDLIKFLADMRDPRASAALTKALTDFDPGKNDDDVKASLLAIKAMAQGGKKLDPSLVQALWTAFAKLRASSKSGPYLARDIQDAVLAVRDPSWAVAAVQKIGEPVDPKNESSSKDQFYWQFVSIQLIGQLKPKEAIKPLVTIVVAPTKEALRPPAKAALLRMAVDAEPVLLRALDGSDPDFAKLETKENYPDKSYIAIVSDALAAIGRPAGRNAVLAALEKADNDTNRTVIGQAIYWFPRDPKVVEAFTSAYNKTSAESAVGLLGGVSARGALARVSANFFDPKLTDWLLKEVVAAGKLEKELAEAIRLPALESAIRLMTPDQVKAVGEAVAKDGTDREKGMFKLAKEAVDKCVLDVPCYLKLLDEPIPSNVGTANMKFVKAAWMAAIRGDDATRDELVKRLDKIRDPGTRLAVTEAILYLSPKGSASTADALEKVIKGDEDAGNTNQANASISTVALSLRSRAL